MRHTVFLGTQGDPWDAEKDMACALGGALVAAALEWGLDRRAAAKARARRR
jgi:uncharacterized membrane protein YjdF